MPGFQYNVVGVGPMCEANCTVRISKHEFNIYIPAGTPIITGWRENYGRRIWCMYLLPNIEGVPLSSDPVTHKTPLKYFSTYDLPIVEALDWYFHVDAGFLVRNTSLKYIKAEKFVSWRGLTYQNAAKYCPIYDETLKGHIVQVRQGIRSTKPNT